jgi:hypothetical protein
MCGDPGLNAEKARRRGVTAIPEKSGARIRRPRPAGTARVKCLGRRAKM